MRKLRLAALAAALLLLGAACAAETPPEAPEEDLIVVGMSQVGAESDWRVANSESMKAVFTEERGYRLLFADARQKRENQITAIRRFIQQQVDYIVLMPISETGWGSVLQEAREAGIPVVLVDRMVDVEDQGLYAAHIGSDFRREGEAAAEWIAANYPAEERVGIVHIQGTLGSTAQLGRTAALEEAAAAHPNWEILVQLDGDFTRAKAYEVMTDYLRRLPEGEELDVVYCENDNEAFGALQALEEQGYACGPGGVDVITFDATRNALIDCMNGRISLAVECNPLLGPLAEEVIETLASGGTPEKHRYVDEQVFTPEDLTEAFIESREY